MRLEDSFPAFVCDLVYNGLGIAGTITALQSMGDTEAAQALYSGYALQLTQWGQTVPGAPSTAALTPFAGMAVG
jgi:hypothetical protein